VEQNREKTTIIYNRCVELFFEVKKVRKLYRGVDSLKNLNKASEELRKASITLNNVLTSKRHPSYKKQEEYTLF
jgi:hypothetical protein